MPKIVPREFVIALDSLENLIWDEYGTKDGNKIDIDSFNETMSENSPIRVGDENLIYWEVLQYIPISNSAEDATRLLRLMPLRERIYWLYDNGIRICDRCGCAFTEGYLYGNEYYCSKSCLEKNHPRGDKSDECYWTDFEGRDDICVIVNREKLLRR